jgi:hypothetical protein
MIFGYNTDVKSGNTVYHVQTEDRGEKNPVIDSVIYVKGQIVERRRTPYDLAQTAPERLQEMVKQQHRSLVDAIRGGNYAPPGAEETAAPAPAPAAVAAAAPAAAPAPAACEPAIELLNAADIESAGRLLFRVLVRQGPGGGPLAGAAVEGILQCGEGADARAQAAASDDGVAEIVFEPPQAGSADVLFCAAAAGLRSIVKYRLSRA